MKLTVQLYTGEDHVGTIVYDADTGIISENPESTLLENVLDGPVFVEQDGDLKDIYVEDDAELFMRSLYLHYKSVGLAASKAVES